jgi:asparagine synthase (glutamine-hydrolysing)
MNRALRHRGPDDHGIAEWGQAANSKQQAADSRQQSAIISPQSAIEVVLGNTRLAILDLSAAGHQPMADREAGLTLTYNGEIYNFRELRAEIGGAFGPWSSHTDTEVVLRAYRRWGVAAFAKFRGMFALAIWDAARRELILARDRFGIKPLYYASKQQTANGTREPRSDSQSEFLFASELRALLATGRVKRKLSDAGLASYLEFGSVQAPATIVADVHSLLPGHYLRVTPVASDLGISHHRFAQVEAETTQRIQSKHKEDRGEAVATLKEKLTESVRAHLVSDVPLGVFLSGGMDSSALVALMSKVTKEKPKTFSVVFNEPRFSEAPHARAIARQFQTDHHELSLDEAQLLADLPRALTAMDQPTMDGVNTFVVSKAVKEAGVTVALSGLGGDELFAGYPTFRRARRMQNLSTLSRQFLRSFASVGKSRLNGSVQRNKFWQLAECDGSAASIYAITRQLFSDQESAALQGFSPQRHRGSTEAVVDLPKDAVNAISRLELQGYMTNTLLRDTDFMSMAHSLEVRVPFVDHEVASYVLGLPGAWKLNGSRPKPLLADVVGDLLPAEFLGRPKMGFTLPFEKWLRGGLGAEVAEILNDSRRMTAVGLDAASVATLWQRFQRAPASVGWSRPWSLYVLAKWCELNDVSI